MSAWATLAPRMLSYPPTVPAPPPELVSLISPWLEYRESRWVLVRLPRTAEWERFGLEERVSKALAKRDSLTFEREKVQEHLKRERGRDYRRLAELNRHAKALLKALEEAERNLADLERFGQGLDLATRRLKELATCPVCRELGELYHRSGDSFVARCIRDGCDATWEIRSDGVSSGRIPVLSLKGLGSVSPTNCAMPQWVDNILGCDVLAIPKGGGGATYTQPRTSPVEASEMEGTA